MSNEAENMPPQKSPASEKVKQSKLRRDGFSDIEDLWIAFEAVGFDEFINLWSDRLTSEHHLSEGLANFSFCCLLALYAGFDAYRVWRLLVIFDRSGFFDPALNDLGKEKFIARLFIDVLREMGSRQWDEYV